MGRQVLVPVDDSVQAWDALEYALTEHADGEIVVLHVVDPKRSLLEGDVFGSTEDRARAEERAENVLEEAREIAETFDATVTGEIQHGDPVDEIVAVAEREDVDQIVMGSHGRSDAARILLGSVAERVVRQAPVPVTVVR